jgi:two-component system response regulator FlrC
MQPKKSILIIDNDDHLRQTLALILQQAGYMVATSCLATGVNRLFEGWLCDLIIVGVNQPNSKGTALVTEIHRIVPEARILLLTGNLLNGAFLSEQNLDVFDYLVKPIDPSLILDAVSGLLSRAAKHQGCAGSSDVQPSSPR